MDLSQWEFLGPTGPLRPGVAYTLRNRIVDRSLRYGERENGIELEWDRSATLANVELVRSGGGTTVRYGDRIAIRVAGGGHLRYGERDEGINLVWSSSPVYEWVIAGDRPTTPVPIRRRVQLVNVDHGDYLCYAERDTGINLRWWADTGGFGSYPPLPMPQQYRGPSGQPGQVELHGTAASLSLFHGGTDDELDWHIHLRLAELDRHVLYRHLLEHGKGAQTANFVAPNQFSPLREDQLTEISCEWMVLDAWQNLTFDEKFYSADVTDALRLQESAWSISWRVAEEQDVFGASETAKSGLTNMPVRVQGPLVNDAEHRFKVEIHPLDSVAYAVGTNGRPLASTSTDPSWPARALVWRVAAFTNSSFHRVNNAEYVQRDRTTTWYLPLPGNAARAREATVSVRPVQLRNRGPHESGWVDDYRRTTADQYATYGVRSHSWAVETDPRDGTTKLRVTVTMERPDDRWGGMFVTDYAVAVASAPAVTSGGPHELDAFVHGAGGHDLVWRHLRAGVWSGWDNLGGDLASGPAVTAGGPHDLDVFVHAATGHDLLWRYVDNGVWSGWENLGGDLASGPAVTAGGPHDLDVFAHSAAGHDLVWRYYAKARWSEWQNLGGDLAAGPAVTSGGPHDLDVFVHGAGGHDLVWRHLDGGVWSGWINLGVDLALASSPAVTAGGPHDLDVFVHGAAGNDLVWRHLDGGVWSGWVNLGGDLAPGSSPAVTAGGPHDLDVFVHGAGGDDLVWRHLQNGQWSGWINLGGDLA